MSDLTKQKKSFRLPHVFLILMIIMLVVTVMSWIIPSGQFARTEQGAIDPAQFSYVTNENPINPISFFAAIPNGIIGSVNIIVCIIVITGVLRIIECTGAIAAGLQKVAAAAKGKESVVVVILTLVFGMMGVIGFGEGALPFVPMAVSVALALGYDRMVGVGIVQLGVCIGFTTGAFNIFTTGVSQNLAGLPIYTGWQFRLAEFAICFLALAFFMIRYCGKIKRDPMKSVMPEYREGRAVAAVDVGETTVLNAPRVITLFLLGFAFIFQAVGSIILGWGMSEISGLYLIIAIVVVLVNRINANTACVEFCKGTASIMPAILVIGLARAIYILMDQAKMVDTIIHTIAETFQGKSPVLIILILYLVVIGFNFFVVSASGKAFILFPILKPLAEILGINQQVVVTVFQLGDGFTNYLFPTSGGLMAALELGGVTFGQWVKFCWKIITALVLLGAAFSLVAQVVGLGPF